MDDFLTTLSLEKYTFVHNHVIWQH